MSKLTRDNLYSLEKYAAIRPDFRARVMAHKANRRLAIGPHAALYFEDALTMQCQVQEMLRLERIFEPEGVQEELDVYNPLIPDGSNWKVTFMVEYEDEGERRTALARLIGIEKRVWVQAEGCDKVYPIANEDMERETEDKTAAVHFLRFDLTPEIVAAVKQGASVRAGIDHPGYREEVKMPPQVRDSLAGDLH
ncbi:DUF3501 family protein [Sulfuricella sp.]|uniref:DUF3501 family protein n=1 Tax=Sulfuricella sp. TaxID=2099377 RepID=UPI002B776D08|nr:DUF3501 family protein [Sulfuricella sp.]HUX63687.1 DUF3501 family protein [Sulfuricella sp.]